MRDFRLQLAASASTAQELKRLGDELEDAVQAAVGRGVTVRRCEADHDDDCISQEIVVSTEQGSLEVTIVWSRYAQKTRVSVSSSAAITGPALYVALVPALAAAFYVSDNPELLPVLPGVRVVLGGIAGLIAGFLLVAIGSFVTSAGKPKIDPALEEKVRGAVRHVLLSRGSMA